MAYLCELGTGQSIYLDNQGNQTIITTISHSAGQQQQASNGVQTGEWTSPPEVFRTPNGVVIKINTTSGEYFLQVQGNSMGVMSQIPSLGGFQQIQLQQIQNTPIPSMSPMPPMPPMRPIQPIQPIQSMPPMKMGNMEMNPMQMRMGNMEMSMGSHTANAPETTRQFCSQCGAKLNPNDRFCSSCGHKLG
jgi:NADH pyrophosphatase NudC (nudix superfamily)